MEKQHNPGLWIAAAALAAVVVMLIAMPGEKPPQIDKTTATEAPQQKPKNPADQPDATQSPAPNAVASTEPVVKATPGSPVVAANPTVKPAQPITDDPDTPPAPPAKLLPPADRENTLHLLDNIQFALRDYRTVLGENPVGTNAEITSALLGNNRKQAKIPLPDGATVNGAGEMCDLWGTPYFFHQQSGTKMEIRSAGPDRVMWTADDLMM